MSNKKLNCKFNARIRWDGYDTRKMFHWYAYGNTFEEIWDTTVNAGINDWEDWETYVLGKKGMTQEDFYDEEDNFLEEEYYNALIYDMSDEEYRDLICSCKGKAYYSNFEIDED